MPLSCRQTRRSLARCTRPQARPPSISPHSPTTPPPSRCSSDALNAAALLIAKGANLEVPEEGGFRALHIAAESGDARLVELLLDHQAQVDAKADDGTTPLGVAARKGRDAIATLLRSRGAT